MQKEGVSKSGKEWMWKALGILAMIAGAIFVCAPRAIGLNNGQALSDLNDPSPENLDE
jgi:hypothetical protein